MAEETYLVRFRGIITGPFPREQLILLVRAGQVSKYHAISADGVNWQEVGTLDWLAAALTSDVSIPSPFVEIKSASLPGSSSRGEVKRTGETANLPITSSPPGVSDLASQTVPTLPASGMDGPPEGRKRSFADALVPLSILGGALLIALAVFLHPFGAVRQNSTARLLTPLPTSEPWVVVETSPSSTPIAEAPTPVPAAPVIPPLVSPTIQAERPVTNLATSPAVLISTPPIPASVPVATVTISLSPTRPPVLPGVQPVVAATPTVVTNPVRPRKPARTPPAAATFSKQPSEAEVEKMVKDLQNDLLDLQEANGLWDVDYGKTLNDHSAGSTDMAMWALVASGCDLKEARMKKALAAYLQTATPPFTYRQGFRFNTWSHLVRWCKDDPTVAACRALLMREGPNLVKSIGPDATYTYNVFPLLPGRNRPRQGQNPEPPFQLGVAFPIVGRPGGDNSNTQYGVYGVWAMADARIEVVPAYWQLVDRGWRDMQDADGGWGYSGKGSSYLTMTDAGLNSLYVVIDKLWSQGVSGQYQFLKGFRYTAAAAAGMKNTLAAINHGWQWYQNPVGRGQGGPMIAGGDGYALFGMQRLGVASGRKYIGGRNWLEEIVDSSQGNRAGIGGRNLPGGRGRAGPGATQELAWQLMNLAFGRAPVLFNKLQHNADEMDWNYYPRDVANLTQWAAYQFDRYLNWQIIGVKDELFDLEDAPILIITGNGRLDLPDEFQAKLKEYCARGGTIFLHPNQHNETFSKSARELFTRLYAGEKYSFERLPADHPIYTGGITGVRLEKNDLTRIPLYGLNDGGRDFILLCDGDIAGAWQLRLNASFPEVFRLMMNLKNYAAPSNFQDLAGRLRPKPRPLPAGLLPLKVARLKHDGHSMANPGLYAALAPAVAEKGVQLNVASEVVPHLPELLNTDLIHVTGHRAFTFSSDEIEAIKTALRAGAFLLVDPAYGHPESDKSNQALVAQLGLTTQPVDTGSHPFFAGPVKLQLNNWAQKQFATAFQELLLDGKPVGLLCTVDITAAASGHNVCAYPGANIPFARQLWANLVAAAYDRTTGGNL